MKKIFKVEPLYEGSSIYYAVYKKRFLWGWKFITKFIYKDDAMRVAKELSQPTIQYISNRKNNYK